MSENKIIGFKKPYKLCTHCKGTGYIATVSQLMNNESIPTCQSCKGNGYFTKYQETRTTEQIVQLFKDCEEYVSGKKATEH